MNELAGSDNALLVNNGDGRYLRYFADLDHVLRLTTAWARGFSGGSLDGQWHANYLRGLGACFGMLRARYTFESNDSLMVDLSQSGFPHSYMLARIAADRVEAIAEHMKGAGLTVGEYKAVFLDDLFQSGTVNPALLNKIASAQYANVAAKMDGAFDPRFMCGEPVPMNGTPRQYKLQWCVFDPVANLPVLCGMVFGYNGNDLTRALGGLKLVLRHETAANMSIVKLAEHIDTGVQDIRPLTLTRATVGPTYLPGFTDRSDISVELAGVEDDVVIDIIVDQTRAVSTRETSSLAARLGVASMIRQVFATKTDDELCFERGADAVQRIVILPHRELQHMAHADRTNYEPRYTFVPYTKQGELQ